MSEVKVPFATDGAYGEVSLKHPDLSEEQALAILRGQVDFDRLPMEVQRHNE